jgi:hypothetical protein
MSLSFQSDFSKLKLIPLKKFRVFQASRLQKACFLKLHYEFQIDRQHEIVYTPFQEPCIKLMVNDEILNEFYNYVSFGYEDIN